MTRYESPKSHLTTYHDNNSIVMQFILFELINAFDIIDEIESLIPEINLDSSKKFSSSDRENLDSLTASITRLAGYTQKYMRIFTWNLNDGILAKLKNYCSFFATNLKPLDADVMALQRHADRAWINCLEALDQIRAAQRPSSGKAPGLLKLKSALEKMITRLRNLTKVIANICHQFREDENVLFFILSHQEELDRLYKTDFVVILFCKIFPKGLADAERLLMKKFASRGFDHLIPIISQKIAALDMDMALL
ncbi:MAG: hypothetical protein ACE5GN_00455 [Waddliaceae bacterium]